MTTPLLVVTAFHAGDMELTKKLLKWISDFSDCDLESHSCLLVADAGIPMDQMMAVKSIAMGAFGRVLMIPANGAPGHPPNAMFLAAAKWINQCCKLDWFWLEPDAVPIKSRWLDDLADEYTVCPTKFMGPLIKQDADPSLPAVHLTGTAIYPNDAFTIYGAMPKLASDNVAWDIEAAGAIVPRSSDTGLIHHYWGTREMPPVFVEKKVANSPANHVTLDFINPQAAIFHRSKDGNLIDLLRKKHNLPVKP